MKKVLFSLFAAAALSAAASAQGLQITEWMYSGNSGEYIEFTNTGATAADFTNWSFDDDSGVAGSFSLSGFGLVNPGESVILTEIAASTFRTNWGLSGSVKVVGNNSQNLARGDVINLYNLAALVDTLAFNDQTIPGTVRTQNRSSSIPVADLGLTAASSSWTLASNGDVFGSWISAQGDIGNPGQYAAAAIPEPSTYATIVAALALGAAVVVRRRRAAKA